MRAWGWVSMGLLGCAGGPDETGVAPAADGPAWGRYLGQSVVTGEEVDGDTITTEFGGRAACLRGGTWRSATRDVGSDDLVVFLQGGGACWEGFCLAVTEAPAGIPAVDILDPTLEANPVADWNVAYLPYCDGSLFLGDADHDDDGDGEDDRFHRGLANLSATLDVAQERFPAPGRVLFAGSSGGGFGISLGLPLVRATWPDAEIIALADSAVGIARGPDDPGFVFGLVEEWGATELLPEGCAGCLDGGHLVPVVEHHLEQDPGVRMGVFGAWYDSIIGDVFLDVTPTQHRDMVEIETSRAHAAHPDRYRRFLIDGRMHTTLLGDASGIVGSNLDALEYPPEILAALASIELGSLETTTSADGTRVADWIGALIEGDAAGWPDTVDPAGPAPD
jgi:hypothetical protein